jgi:hypothetical protein
MSEFKLSEYEETIRLVLENHGEFRIYPKGTSMLPMIRQKKDSVVLVKNKEALKKYDVILYRRENGQYVLHRIIKVLPDYYVLSGDNQVVKETFCKNGQIIGVISGFYHGDKYISVSNKKYKIYVHLICDLYPLRKLFLRCISVFKLKF